METAFQGIKLDHFPVCPKSKFKLRNHFRAWISKIWKKKNQDFIERQISALSFIRRFWQQKRVAVGTACSSELSSQMHNTGQIWTDLECAILFAKTFFHSWPSKTQSSKLHYYFFMREQIDHNTIRKRRESVCLALCFFVVFFGKKIL